MTQPAAQRRAQQPIGKKLAAKVHPRVPALYIETAARYLARRPAGIMTHSRPL